MLEELCKRIQHCCARLRRSRNKRNVGGCWLLANNSQHCWMLNVAPACTPCCMLLDVVACCCAKFETCQTFQPTTLNISLFRDRRSVTQQCWICLHSSSNIVGATHAHYTRFTKTYGLCPSHDALQVPTLLAQQCWELLRPPFARTLTCR